MKIEALSQPIPQNEGAFKEDGSLIGIHFLPHSCWRGTWNDLHYHNEYIEILYAEKGTFSIMLNGVVYEISTGSVFIINSGEFHATRSHQPDDPEAALMCLRFMPETMYSAKQNILEFEYNIPQIFDFLGNKRYLSPDIVANSCLPDEFNYLKQEEIFRNFGYALNTRSAAIRIFSWIIRYWYQTATADTSQIKLSTTNTLQQMKTYVEENYQTATLRSAAEALNLSYSYFSRLFNQYMDMSFSEYVNLTRINHSMNALTNTDRSITDIALEVGFSSSSHYIQTFRKLKNISPYQFRKLFQDSQRIYT